MEFPFLQAADEDEHVLEKISFFQDMLISYRVSIKKTKQKKKRNVVVPILIII